MDRVGRIVIAALVLAIGVPAATPALGQPAGRRLALVNAGRSEAGTRATQTLRRALAAQAALEAIAPGDLARALEEPRPAGPPPTGRLAEAVVELNLGREALDGFQTRRALTAAARAERLLLASPPVPEVRDRLAQARFVIGLAHLRNQNRGLAEEAFALAARLAPALRKPDPGRYPPEVIEAVARATRPSAARTLLTVSATFDGAAVFVDGAEVGATPWQAPVARGLHLVQVYSPAHVPDGRVVDLDEDPETVRLDLAPLPIAEQARALRDRLAGERDPVALRRGLASIAELAKVDAALIVLDGDDGPVVASYEVGPNRLSVPRPAASAAGLFGILVPAALPGSIDLVAPSEPPGPWYMRPLGIASIAGAAITAITVGVVLSADRDDPLPRGGNPEPLGGR
jgi:hypothetical protein